MKNNTPLTMLLLILCCIAGTAHPGVIVNPFMFKSATPTPTPADTTAPTLVSATVDEKGQVLTLEFSEAVTVSSGTWDSDWTFVHTANNTGLAYSAGDGTSTIIYDVSANGGVLGTDVPVLNYTQAATVIADAAGNALAPIVDRGVANNAK